MKIETKRFGEIEVREEEFIFMRGSILGFEHLKRFVLLQNSEKTPLWWLQSIEDPAVAFVVANPLLVTPDYAPAFPESDLEMLEIKDNKNIAMLSIITVRSNPLRATANLRAPILINAENRTASQIVLGDSDYPIQYDLADANQNEGKVKSDHLVPSAAVI
ncbi:MAG: flagellar assembly protein FliW [Syntrophales bacterium]